MHTRALGAAGPTVSALGLGAMGMSGAYGPADRAESIATVHAADTYFEAFEAGDNVYVFKFECADGQVKRITEYSNPVAAHKALNIPLG